MHHSIYIGYDPRESEAFAICRHSIHRYAPNIPVSALVLDELRNAGLYRRPMSKRDGKLWDDISEAPCSTEFAISRFLTPILARRGWALFMDCDILARDDVNKLFAAADPQYAVMCVQHPNYVPPETIKMDGQLQMLYRRKNWSSVMLINCEHEANKRLTLGMINEVPGRDLHRFCWLNDDEIGALDPKWNYLVGVSNPKIDPALVHYTSGIPSMPGYENAEYADAWRAQRLAWLGAPVAISAQEVRKAWA